MKVYEVVKSPWSKLPVGTRIVETTPRPSKMKLSDSKWFVREDGKLLFDEELDGKFRLYSNEFKLIEQ